MALWQLGFRSVISGTGGANGRTEWIVDIPDTVKTVYISGDNDEPGQDYARKIAERVGLDKTRNVILEQKDANDYLKAGGTEKEYTQILKKAKKFDVKNVAMIGDLLDELSQRKTFRTPTFSSYFNEATDGGTYEGMVIMISGKQKVGKSNYMLNYLIGMANAGYPCLLISLENDLWMTVQRVLSIKYKKKVKDFTKEDWDKAKEELVDYPFYMETAMDTYKTEDIEKMLEQSKKMYGIKFWGFDHMNFMATRGGNETQQLSEASRDFKLLTRKFGLTTFSICHVRKTTTDKPYITSEDLKGTSSFAQDADMILLLYHTRNGMEVAIDAARASQSHLKLPVKFDGATGVFSDDLERQVVDYGGNEHKFMDDIEEENSEDIDV